MSTSGARAPEQRGATGGSEYADALQGVLDRAVEVDSAKHAAVAPKVPVLRRPAVVLGVFVVFAGVMFYNVRGAGTRLPETPASVEEASAQVSVMIATQVVEAYQREHGELPGTLEEAGLPVGQYDYVPGPDGHFELGATIGGTSVRYLSREGPASLLRSMPPAADSTR